MPLAEMTIAGIFDCGQLLRFGGGRRSSVNRSVQNAQSCRSCTRMPAPSLGRVVMIGRPVRRLLVARLRLHLRIELAQPLGVPRERLDRHRAVDEHRQHRDAPLLFEPLQPVEQLLDAADRERRDDDAPAALGRLRDDPPPAARRRRPARARDRRRSIRPAGSPPPATIVGSGRTGRPNRPRSPPKRIVRPPDLTRAYDDPSRCPALMNSTSTPAATGIGRS